MINQKLMALLNQSTSHNESIAVVTQSKAWACGRLLTGIAGSNSDGGMDVCRECCVLSFRGPCVGRITSPGKTSPIVCLSVISKPQQWGSVGLLGLSNHGKKRPQINPISLQKLTYFPNTVGPSCKQNQLGAQIFLLFLLLFSTRFG